MLEGIERPTDSKEGKWMKYFPTKTSFVIVAGSYKLLTPSFCWNLKWCDQYFPLGRKKIFEEDFFFSRSNPKYNSVGVKKLVNIALTMIISFSHSLSLTHTCIHTPCLLHTLSLSLSLCLFLYHFLSFSLSLTLLTLSVFLIPHLHILPLSLSLTHMYTHTQTHAHTHYLLSDPNKYFLLG